MQITHKMEEVLESIWTVLEKGSSKVADIKKESEIEISTDLLEALLKEGLITHAGDEIKFTAKGENEARNVIRRHRLAERLLVDVLKRDDEKYVTEKSYENPMFVEDVVRNVAEQLNKDDNFTWYSIEAESLESIHNHSAYAYIEKD